MANTGLNNFYQTIYAAFNVVSRELIGFIPRVSKDASAEMVTLNQPIRSPIVPMGEIQDITPSNISPTGASDETGYVNLQLTKQKKYTFHLTAEEEKGLMASGTVNDITMQRFAQAFRALGNAIEGDIAGLYRQASRAYGTPGTTPFATGDDFTDATEVGKILDDNGAPQFGRSLVLNTAAHAKLVGKQSALFKTNEAGGDGTRMSGNLNEMMLGFSFGKSGQLPKHDASQTLAGVAVNKAGGQAVGDTTLTVDGGGAGEILNAGDIITVAGSTSKYVAKAAAASATSLEIQAPGLTDAAADNAAVTALADYTPSLAFTRDAIHLACRVPAVPARGDGATERMYVTDPHTGLTFEVAVFGQYRQVTYEVGIVWGVVANKPEHMAILLG